MQGSTVLVLQNTMRGLKAAPAVLPGEGQLRPAAPCGRSWGLKGPAPTVQQAPAGRSQVSVPIPGPDAQLRLLAASGDTHPAR